MSQRTDQWIEEHAEQLIADTKEILHIASVQSYGDDVKPGAPFGAKVKEAGDCMVKAARKSCGFEARENNGYYIYIDAGDETGKDKEMLGIICHLDVVPEGSGWDYPAYGAELVGDRIYARGAIDDKGPAMAALYALKAVQESGYEFKRQVRLIFGLNEETGMECIEKYAQCERIPDISFSPDGCYPVTNSEKSILHASYKSSYDSGICFRAGEAANIVPGEAEISFCGKTEVVKGVQSHASMPEGGDNAAQKAIRYLAQQNLPEEDAKRIAALNRYFGTGYYGEGVDLDKADVSGRLTLNVGLVRWNEQGYEITLDLRCPTSLPEEAIRTKLAAAFKEACAEEVSWNYSQGFSIPDDSELVQKLMKVYQNRSGDMESKPLKIGGGTYARHLPNAVSFGPEGYMCEAECHVANEFITIPQLLINAKMLADAIIALACE